MSSPNYVLGSDDPEIARLDSQAAAIEGGTAALLTSGGIGPGMRVLELGTGLGHVAFQLSAMVGPDGSVTAIDQTRALMEVAEARRRERGLPALVGAWGTRP
jgi:protein-L-isoaspartate O-methyltransferase